MKRAISLLIIIPFLISCSSAENGTRNTLTGSGGYAEGGDTVVQSADGSLYSIGCLQTSASAIKQKGAVAMNDCKVTLSSSSGAIETEVGNRGKFFSNSYAYVYYPPTYYSPNYSNYNYGSNYSSPYYYGNNGSNSSSYNCYNDNRFKNDTFCAFVFGSSSNFNCYYILGYNNNNYNSYSSYYNPSCSSQCIYSYNPSVCQSRCYNQVPVYYY